MAGPPPTDGGVITPLVAVINNDTELINMLLAWFEAHSIRGVSANLSDLRRGHVDVASFARRHAPQVIVLDVGKPYQSAWDFACVLRMLPEFAAIPIVMTTANKAALEKAVGATDAYEVHGDPDDLDALTFAVVRAAAAP